MNEDQLNDADDRIATTLRMESHQARLKPSSQLREQTLRALQRSTESAMRFHRPSQRRWTSVLAAAAVVTLTVLMARVFIPVQPDLVGPDQGSQAEASRPGFGVAGPSRFLPEPPSVRLSALTQPLQREAAALESDLRRISQHMRRSIFRRHAVPASTSQPG